MLLPLQESRMEQSAEWIFIYLTSSLCLRGEMRLLRKIRILWAGVCMRCIANWMNLSYPIESNQVELKKVFYICAELIF